MKFLNDKYKKRGAVAAIIFHAILFLLFLFFGLTQPVPLPDDSMEIAMDFGFTESGMGDVESMVVSENPTQETEQVSSEEISQQTEASAQEVATQEEESFETTETSNSSGESNSEEEQQEEERKLNSTLQSIVNNPFANSGGGGEGTGTTPGNTGNPDGKEGKGVLGGGMGWELAGRKIVKAPVKPKGFQEEGTVVVKIKVGKNGKVIDAKIDYQRTATSSPTLHQLALKSARTAMFDAVSTAKVHEWGSITYKFRLSGG